MPIAARVPGNFRSVCPLALLLHVGPVDYARHAISIGQHRHDRQIGRPGGIRTPNQGIMLNSLIINTLMYLFQHFSV